MSAHFNALTGQFVLSEQLIPTGKSQHYDLQSGNIVFADFLVPKLGKTLFDDAALDLNFAGNKSLTDSVSGNNLITFTRASSGTFVGADGLIKTTPVNILLYSEQMNEWIVGNGSSVTANQAVAPDGTNTADRVQHGSGGSSWIRQDILTAGTTYTASVYAKAVTPGTSNQFTFDIGGLSSVFTATNEWQRFTFTGTASNASFYLNNGDDSFATDVYFWGAQVEEGSVATDYIPTGSTISGAPRFDHDPVTNASLGLLIEEARTNKIANNWSLSNTASGLTLSEDTSISNPDGTTGAIKMLAASGSSRHDVQIQSASETTNHAHSVFVKKGNHRYIGFCQGGTANNIYAIFDTDTKTITRDGAHNNATLVSSGVKEYGNGWFRIHVVGFTSGTTLRVFLAGGASQAGFKSWSATGNEFAYTWGPQKEFGDFPASFIPTSGSSVTRAADVVEITGTNFSSFYNSSEGTIYSEVAFAGIDNSSFPRVYQFGDESASDSYHRLIIDSSAAPFHLDASTNITASGTQASFNSNTVTIGQAVKTAYAYKANDFKVDYSVDSSGASADTSGAVPAGIDELLIGNRPNGSAPLTGHIKRLAFFSVRKTDEELEELTS